jgi:hypothetical protein
MQNSLPLIDRVKESIEKKKLKKYSKNEINLLTYKEVSDGNKRLSYNTKK